MPSVHVWRFVSVISVISFKYSIWGNNVHSRYVLSGVRKCVKTAAILFRSPRVLAPAVLANFKFVLVNLHHWVYSHTRTRLDFTDPARNGIQEWRAETAPLYLTFPEGKEKASAGLNIHWKPDIIIPFVPEECGLTSGLYLLRSVDLWKKWVKSCAFSLRVFPSPSAHVHALPYPP